MDVDKEIDNLILSEQYSLTAEKKEKKMLLILIEQIKNQMANKFLKIFYEKSGGINSIKKIASIPLIPVSLFKEYELRTVPKKEIVRILTSSGTTGQERSKIYLNKKTAFRQSKALVSILENYLGKKRKPMLIIDTESVNNSRNGQISARRVAIRGISQFGKDLTYVLEGDDSLKLNEKKLDEFLKKHSDEEVIIFGFTFIIWDIFYKQLKELNRNINLKAVLIHSGGWKKLENKKVDKEIFNEEIGNKLGINPSNIKDMYGLVEQAGVVFVDCEFGNKHTPNFAEVIIRNPLTMKEVGKGEEGLIEISSVLPDSYPGQALITEDIGLLEGIDDCKCGRKGKYFRFVSRVKESEARGCGDTFEEKK